jgi:CubicO group peptidase (beta-lactamase class C family)
MAKVPIRGQCDARFARVREVFEQNFEGPEVGAAVSVTVDGRPVVDLWGGYADRERARSWESDTLVNVYSTTKGMTAICAHQLVEQGKLDLDKPVAHYWPEFAAQGKDSLPVRHLLSHRAGLPAVGTPLAKGSVYDWGAVTRALADTKPWWEPGSKHGYHALTYGHLVGEVVRRVSGESLGTYFRNHVAAPLGLDFHIGLEAKHDGRVAHMIPAPQPPAGGAAPPPGVPPELAAALGKLMKDMLDPKTLTWAAFHGTPGHPDDPNTRAWRGAEIPAANGHGTARALARVYGALARGGEVDGVRVLERDTIERARTEHSFGPDAVLGGIPMRFGLGFMLRHDLMPISPNPSAFGHPGAGGSIGFADPDARVGFGYVMNQMQAGLLGGSGGFALIGALYASL